MYFPSFLWLLAFLLQLGTTGGPSSRRDFNFKKPVLQVGDFKLQTCLLIIFEQLRPVLVINWVIIYLKKGCEWRALLAT